MISSLGRFICHIPAPVLVCDKSKIKNISACSSVEVEQIKAFRLSLLCSFIEIYICTYDFNNVYSFYSDQFSRIIFEKG